MTLTQLEARRSDLLAAVIRRDNAGDFAGADARMQAARRIERAIYRILASATDRCGRSDGRAA
jgi:hypothetical protein